jgi:ubiquinone/menaquinone biosynthesis C-methylase UbiE
MTHREAVALIRDGVPSRGGVWADLGAGGGTFTKAVADLVGDDGVVYAVDRDAGVLNLATEASGGSAEIRAILADFSEPLSVPALDGIVMANALHFVADPESVLARILEHVHPSGAFLLIEYDLERGTPWIPHPIPRSRVGTLARRVGLTDVREVGSTPSRFGRRDIYAVAARKR